MGLTHLCALPRKWPKLVAYRLQELFGLLGCPRIFHTDNGKEFIAAAVLQFLWSLNPGILSVTGRSRHPRDQGSVENMNKMVKRVLGSVLAERRLSGKNPNWTEVLVSLQWRLILSMDVVRMMLLHMKLFLIRSSIINIHA